MLGRGFVPLPFIFANKNYTLRILILSVLLIPVTLEICKIEISSISFAFCNILFQLSMSNL
ncbi:MAG: hypothetical protein PWQ70_858 [Clostridiales bacterium]|jgi:hypothetical protein|nr:hypothetical protein [Clostridiales bacterium]